MPNYRYNAQGHSTFFKGYIFMDAPTGFSYFRNYFLGMCEKLFSCRGYLYTPGCSYE